MSAYIRYVPISLGSGGGGGGGGGITSINGDTTAAQTFVAASTGTDFTVATVAGVTTLALPTASASNRGLLSSADFTAFNSKQAAIVPLQQIKNVAKNGNDGTADGSVAKPYLTVKAAVDSITDATSTKQYIVQIAPGRYTESAAFVIKPWVFLNGGHDNTLFSEASAPAIIINGAGMSVTFGAVGTFIASGLQFEGGALSFSAPLNSVIGFNNCLLMQALTVAGSSNFHCNETSFYSAVSMSGAGGFSDPLASVFFGAVTVTNYALEPSATFFLSSVTLSGTSVFGAQQGAYSSLIIGTGGTAFLGGCFPWDGNTTEPGVGTITTTGTVTIVADAASLPKASNMTLSGGTTLTLSTPASAVGYVPTTPGDWSVVPVSVQQGLDTLAARTFVAAATGTDFTVSTVANVTTIAIPSASATARGVITTGTQTFAGDKTFTGTIAGKVTPLAQVKYVSKTGNDSTGNGSITAPFLTVKGAQDSITDATTSKQYQILVAPGIYNEVAGYSFKDYCHIEGITAGGLAAIGNSVNINIDGGGMTYTPGDASAQVYTRNINWFGGIITIAGSNYGQFVEFNNCTVNNSVSASGNCVLGGDLSLFQNGSLSLDGGAFATVNLCFFQGGSITVANGSYFTATSTGLLETITINTGSNMLVQNGFYSAIVANEGANVQLTNSAAMNPSTFAPGEGTIAINAGGTTATVRADVESLPTLESNITYSGTTPVLTKATNAYAVAYTPTTPGDWASQPADVKEGLDILAAKPSVNVALTGPVNVTGSYPGDVFVTGDATVTGDLTIAGDFIVTGNIISALGKAITVHGDTDCNSFNFTPTSGATAQSNVLIGGDLHAETNSEFKRNEGQSPTFTVLGDFTSGLTAIIDISGRPQAFGLPLEVHGNCTVGSLIAKGGDSSGTNFSGWGSNVTIHGTLNVTNGDFTVSGGDMAFNGMGGGRGGNIVIGGDLIAKDVKLKGGSATGGANSAGNVAGTIAVGGNITCNTLDAAGGDSASNNGGDKAGSGGTLTCVGNVTCTTDFYFSAGLRSGAITTGSGADPAAGGNVTIGGDAIIDNIYVDSNVQASTGGSIAAGNGGTLIIGGAFSGRAIIADGATNNSTAAAGNAGTITIKGLCTARSQLSARGGEAVGAQNGSAGVINLLGGGVTNNIQITDGTSGTAPTASPVGLFFAGFLDVTAIAASNRAGVRIQPTGPSDGFYPSCQLNVDNLPVKSTFNDAAGTATASFSSYLGNSIFIYDVNTGWYPISAAAAGTILTFDSTPSAGGAVSEALTVTGLLTTDTILSVTQMTMGSATRTSLPLIGWDTVVTNGLTAQWVADPGPGAIVRVAVKR